MNKKTKIILYILSIIILALFATAGTISVSQISYESNSSFYDGETLVVEFLSSGKSEELTYSLTPEQINSEISGEVNQTLEVSIKNQEIWTEYAIEDRDLRRIQAIEFVVETFPTEDEATNWAEKNCIDADNSGSPNYIQETEPYFTRPFIRTRIFCATPNIGEPTINVGTIQNPPATIFETTWSVQAEDEEPQRATISNSGSGNGSVEKIGENVNVEWLGLINTGENSPNPVNTLAGYSNSTGWSLLNQNEYQKYVNYLEAEVPKEIEKISEEDSVTYEATIEDIESRSDKIYQEASKEYINSPIYGAEEPKDLENEWNNGIWTYNPGRDIVWPNFLLRVNTADYLTIHKSMGIPEVTEHDEAIIPEIGGSTASIKVKNTGEELGEFEGRIENCSEGFTGEGLNEWHNVEGNNYTVFEPRISFSHEKHDQGQFEGTCEFVVEDRTSGVQDSVSFDVTGEKLGECAPGQQFLEVEERNGDVVDVIYECAEDGISLEEVDVCSENERGLASNKGYECENNSEVTTQTCSDLGFMSLELPRLLCEIKDSYSELTGLKSKLSSYIKTLTVVAGISLVLLIFRIK